MTSITRMSHEEINDVERHACGQNQQTMWKMFENARRRQMATLEELIEWVWGSTFQGPANWNDLPREIATEFVAIAAAMICLLAAQSRYPSVMRHRATCSPTRPT